MSRMTELMKECEKDVDKHAGFVLASTKKLNNEESKMTIRIENMNSYTMRALIKSLILKMATVERKHMTDILADISIELMLEDLGGDGDGKERP